MSGRASKQVEADEGNKATRKQPAAPVLRRLYAVSGNVCAWETCRHPIFDVSGTYVAQLCHIEAAEKGGERFNAASNDEERAAFENLLFLCYEHHQLTNDVAAWPVERMRRMKEEHETRFADARLFCQIEKQFLDYTALNPPKKGVTYARFRKYCGYSDDDDLTEYIDEYAQRLAKVDRPQRELLCIIGTLLKDGDVTHDELVMKTRTNRDQIATQIGLLDKYKLAWFKYDDYTKNADIAIKSAYTDTPPLEVLRDYAESVGESYEAIIVDLEFNRLD